MKVNFYPNSQITTEYNRKNARNIGSKSVCEVKHTNYATYPSVYFTGKLNPQKLTPKLSNLSGEKAKLINKLDEILKKDISEKEMTKEELTLYYQTQANTYSLKLLRRLQELEAEINILLNYGQRGQGAWEQGVKIQKEVLKIQRNLDNPPKIKPPQPKQVDTDTDFVLINKFKSAAMDDNFDFIGVYNSHYAELKDIKSLRELRKKYPTIKIPKNPKEIVSKKIEGSLTRDFYEELDRIVTRNEGKEAREYVTQKVESIIDSQLKKTSNEQKKEISRKIVPMTVTRIKKRYYDLKDKDAISTVPIARKQNQQIFTDNDKKLLTVDYNDFVLHVIREQYLEHKKAGDIVYKYNKGKPGHRVENTLKVSELRDSEYKFSKPQEKIKTIVADGEGLKLIQRNYDYFSKPELLERLEFHADRQEMNEDYLDILLQFSTCRFEPEDIEMMKTFLRESDKAIDGKKTVKEITSFLHENNISPKGTERLNEIEYQRQMAILKEEQKQHARLNRLQTTFDDRMNVMYANNMAYSADFCSDFRPANLEKDSTKTAEEILKITDKYINPENPIEILNKDRMALELTRWRKYSEYCKSTDSADAELLKKAMNFAQSADGTVDVDKAGKYLLNAEAVKTYPSAFEYARNRDAAETIMKQFKDDKDMAVEYLCKYDDYLDMNPVEKSKISNILSIFDKKSTFDKTLLKPIIEEEYIKVPTSDTAIMTENGSKKVTATIATNAKSGIYDYYKFPKCLDYFEDFEYALPQFATTFGRSGIKKIDKNYYELKIKGKDDRLLARNSDYIFNEFDPTGLH